MSAARPRKQFSRNCSHYNYKVILLGDYGVGKTSLFHRIKNGSSNPLLRLDSGLSSLTTAVYQDTIDRCSRTFTLRDGKNVQVDFWDTGSAERFRGSLTGNYYRGATGIILMYDATDPSSLTNLRTWMEDAETYTHNATFLLLGNKYDKTSGSYHVDDDLSNAFATSKDIPLHFKISTERSDEATLTRVFRSFAEHMHKKMEESYSSGTKGDFPLTCAMDASTVTLLTANTNPNTHSSCMSCSKRC